MTEAMPFLQKAILLSYAPRPLAGGIFVSPIHCAFRFAAALTIVITSSKTKPATQHNQT